MDYKAEIHSWVDANRCQIVSFLQELLQIPSVTGDEGAIQAHLAQVLRDMGGDVDVFVPSKEELRKHPAYVASEQSYDGRPNVVATFPGKGGGRSLLFNGHVDVIPEGAEENWKHGCWSGDLKDGKIYGRGASDMKSGVAAMTMAIQAVRACGVPLRGDIITEYVMDEELTGNGTLACVVRGYKADAGICCETSSMCVQPASIGRIWFHIRIKGKAAGIQERYNGVSGIELGYLVTQAVSAFELVRLEKVRHPLYPDILRSIPCMVGQFESGTYASAFPDACLLKGSMATVPGENSDQVKEEFVTFVQEYCGQRSDWLREHPPEIIFTGYFAEPSEIPVDSPIVSIVSREYARVRGVDTVISGRQGAADIRHLNQYGGTPTVIFGPGLTEQMHANNEWCRVDDYVDAVKILADTIVEWCDVAEKII